MAQGDDALAFADVSPGKFKAVVDGKETAFEVPIRTLRIRVLELRSLRHYMNHEPNTPSRPLLERVLRGVAVLDDEDTIEVIGRPASRDTKISVGFRVLSEADLEEYVDRYRRAMKEEWDALREDGAKPRSFSILPDRLGVDIVPNVSLSFSDSDWEIGNPDEWWSQMHISEGAFDELEAAAQSGRFISLQIGVHAWNIYSDRSYYVPSEKRFPWYVKPSKYSAEVVRGVITVIDLETARAKAALDIDEAQGAASNADGTSSVSALSSEYVDVIRKSIFRSALAICATMAILWLFFR